MFQDEMGASRVAFTWNPVMTVSTSAMGISAGPSDGGQPGTSFFFRDPFLMARISKPAIKMMITIVPRINVKALDSFSLMASPGVSGVSSSSFHISRSQGQYFWEQEKKVARKNRSQ